jgi:lipoprotein-releasing system ATP-binding protein
LAELILETRNLTRYFPTPAGELGVLKGLDLDVERGEFVSIVGPSGVGKSTLLHILGGLDKPSGGEIRVNGRPIEGLNDAQASSYRNKVVGFVFQFHYLMEEFSALENVMLPLMVRREARNKSHDWALELLEEVGLAERADHHPNQLSGGERQRVAVARAMAGSPQILIADEPTGDLDAHTAAELHGLLVRLNETRKTTVVVATHDQALAARADTKYLMSDGRLQRRE